MFKPDPCRRYSRAIEILGVASGTGAPDTRCAEGPAAIRRSELLAALQQSGVNVRWRVDLFPAPGSEPLKVIPEICSRLSGQVVAIIADSKLPLIFSGDHACAIGTWSGVASAVSGRGLPGLVWIDAHMDSHTMESSRSGQIHGMPLAALLGYGARELVGLDGFSPKLSPKNVALVGVRSYEQAEADLLERIGVKVFFMNEIHERGIAVVMQEALAIANSGTPGYGVSIDLDAFTPRESPGVGSPVADGLHYLELDQQLKCIARDPRLLAIELAEFNPHRDIRGKTLTLIRQVLLSMLS